MIKVGHIFMACEQCAGDQCPKGSDYHARVKAMAEYIEDSASQITLADVVLVGGITSQDWYERMKDCVECVGHWRIVYENRPTRNQPRKQYLTTSRRRN